MPRDMVDLQASIVAASAAMPAAMKRATGKAALFTKQSVVAQLLRDTGDGRLSGAGKRGAKLGVKYTVYGAGPTSKAYVQATGWAWPLIERDVKPHQIPKQRSAKARRRYVVIGGQPYSRAEHPGTKGKHTFERGGANAAPLTPKVYQQEVRDAIRKAWL